MNELNPISFDEVTGIEGGEPKLMRKRRKADKKPLASPCNGCPCAWVCAGCQFQGGAVNVNKAMACTVYAKFAGMTHKAVKFAGRPKKGKKSKPASVNKMPSRVVFAKLFG